MARRPIPIAVLALSALALVLPAGASAASKSCRWHSGTLASNSYGRVWHGRTSLYACTTVYGKRPRDVRIGPWKAGTQVVFDGDTVVWTVPLVRGGVRSDRAWAVSAEDPRHRWLQGAQLVPASAAGPAREARVQRLLQRDEGAGWVTTTGDVVLALHDPADEPRAIGTLPAALQPAGNVVVVGSWPAADPAQLAASATLVEDDGDGDECGGANGYTLTVVPDPAAPRVGATWTGNWERVNCG